MLFGQRGSEYVGLHVIRVLLAKVRALQEVCKNAK